MDANILNFTVGVHFQCIGHCTGHNIDFVVPDVREKNCITHAVRKSETDDGGVTGAAALPAPVSVRVLLVVQTVDLINTHERSACSCSQIVCIIS